jgi:hypothetical protein
MTPPTWPKSALCSALLVIAIVDGGFLNLDRDGAAARDNADTRRGKSEGITFLDDDPGRSADLNADQPEADVAFGDAPEHVSKWTDGIASKLRKTGRDITPKNCLLSSRVAGTLVRAELSELSSERSCRKVPNLGSRDFLRPRWRMQPARSQNYCPRKGRH